MARMEDAIADLTRGNTTEVKVVLASVVAALACYQVFLMAVGYGRLRLRALEPGTGSAGCFPCSASRSGCCSP
jgi:hypothetical protein